MIELDVAHLYNCEVCLANNGVERINPGPTIYKSTHWLVEHIYPCPSLWQNPDSLPYRNKNYPGDICRH